MIEAEIARLRHTTDNDVMNQDPRVLSGTLQLIKQVLMKDEACYAHEQVDRIAGRAIQPSTVGDIQCIDCRGSFVDRYADRDVRQYPAVAILPAATLQGGKQPGKAAVANNASSSDADRSSPYRYRELV